jgi:hypothetical protein
MLLMLILRQAGPGNNKDSITSHETYIYGKIVPTWTKLSKLNGGTVEFPAVTKLYGTMGILRMHAMMILLTLIHHFRS